MRHLSHSRENRLKQTHLHCFEQFAKKEINQFDQEKAQPKSLEALVETLQKEKEFCSSMYENHFPEVEVLRKKGIEEIPHRRAMYRNHPTLIDDFWRDLTCSFQYAQDKQDKLERQQTLQKMASHSPAFVQRELFALCQKQVISKLYCDLEQIKQQKRHPSSRTEQELLQAAYSDTMQQPYLKGTDVEQRLWKLQEMDKTVEQQRSHSFEHSL